MKAIFLLAMILIDLLLSSIISSTFAYNNIVFIPMTSLLFLSYRMMHNPSSMVLFYGFVTGLVIDLLMSSILFTHAIIYVVALYVLREYQRHFSDTMIEIVIMGLVIIFIKELLLFALLNVMSIIDMTLLRWYGSRLFFTLLGNIPLILFAYFMSNKLNIVLRRRETTRKRSETTLWGFLKD